MQGCWLKLQYNPSLVSPLQYANVATTFKLAQPKMISIVKEIGCYS